MKRLIVFVLLICSSFTICAAQVFDFSNKKVSEYYKNKDYDLIILNYWATYCSPCKKELPDFEKLYEKYRDKKVLVMGVSIDTEQKSNLIRKIVKKIGISYPILYGVSKKFKDKIITGLPKTIILDKDHKIIDEIDGKRDFKYFDERVKKYLGSLDEGIEEGYLLNVKETTYYKLEVKLVEDKTFSTLEVSIEPGTGVHLNGTGYPELTVLLENEKLFEDKLVELKSNGIAENGKKVWEIKLDRSIESDNRKIKVKVKAIPCTENSCRMVKDEFEMRV